MSRSAVCRHDHCTICCTAARAGARASWHTSRGPVVTAGLPRGRGSGHLLDILEHPNRDRYAGKRIFVVRREDYVYLVPFVEDKHTVFLKRIIPSSCSGRRSRGGGECGDAGRSVLLELLQDVGYDYVAVGTLQDLLHILRTEPLALLITDIRLEAYNGLQLVISAPHLPSIVISGFADPVLESDARRNGATYVRKPVNPTGLLKLIEDKLLDASREAQGSSTATI